MRVQQVLFMVIAMFLTTYSSDDDFEKMVMITIGVVITTATCIGMIIEQCKIQKKDTTKQNIALKENQTNRYNTRLSTQLSSRF
jgi:hypothetical protein